MTQVKRDLDSQPAPLPAAEEESAMAVTPPLDRAAPVPGRPIRRAGPPPLRSLRAGIQRIRSPRWAGLPHRSNLTSAHNHASMRANRRPKTGPEGWSRRNGFTAPRRTKVPGSAATGTSVEIFLSARMYVACPRRNPPPVPTPSGRFAGSAACRTVRPCFDRSGPEPVKLLMPPGAALIQYVRGKRPHPPNAGRCGAPVKDPIT